MSNLIYGINPLIISRVEVEPGSRYGHTDLWWRKKGWLYRLLWKNDWCYTRWHPATVIIRGANNAIITEIECCSNKRAYEIEARIVIALDNYLEKLKK